MRRNEFQHRTSTGGLLSDSSPLVGGGGGGGPASSVSGGGGGGGGKDGTGHPDSDAINKLTNVESQRIMAVLETTASNLHILCAIGAIVDSRDEMLDLIDEHIIQAMIEHRKLETQYTVLVNKRKDVNRQTRAKIDDQIIDCRAALKTSIRAICREVHSNPDVVARLKEIYSVERTPGLLVLTKSVDELTTLTFGRLTTTVEEERSRQDELSSIISRERKAAIEMEKLQAAVAKAKAVSTTEVKQRVDSIAALKTTLDKITAESSEALAAMDKDWRANESKDVSHYARLEADLKSTIEAKTRELEVLRDTNRKLEADWRKNKFNVEARLQEKIGKFDDIMLSVQKNIEDLNKTFTADRLRFVEKEKRNNLLNKEFQAIATDAATRKAQRDAEAAEIARYAVAATKIGATWRMFVARKAFLAWKKKQASKRKKKKKGTSSSGRVSSPSASGAASASPA